MEAVPEMENTTNLNEEEAQDDTEESHIWCATEKSMKHHFTTNFKNLKSEVRELKAKTFPDLVANEVVQAVEDKKADVKDVIDIILRSPTLMSQMALLIMLENENVLGKCAQYAKTSSPGSDGSLHRQTHRQRLCNSGRI